MINSVDTIKNKNKDLEGKEGNLCNNSTIECDSSQSDAFSDGGDLHQMLECSSGNDITEEKIQQEYNNFINQNMYWTALLSYIAEIFTSQKQNNNIQNLIINFESFETKEKLNATIFMQNNNFLKSLYNICKLKNIPLFIKTESMDIYNTFKDLYTSFDNSYDIIIYNCIHIHNMDASMIIYPVYDDCTFKKFLLLKNDDSHNMYVPFCTPLSNSIYEKYSFWSYWTKGNRKVQLLEVSLVVFSMEGLKKDPTKYLERKILKDVYAIQGSENKHKLFECKLHFLLVSPDNSDIISTIEFAESLNSRDILGKFFSTILSPLYISSKEGVQKLLKITINDEIKDFSVCSAIINYRSSATITNSMHWHISSCGILCIWKIVFFFWEDIVLGNLEFETTKSKYCISSINCADNTKMVVINDIKYFIQRELVVEGDINLYKIIYKIGDDQDVKIAGYYFQLNNNDINHLEYCRTGDCTCNIGNLLVRKDYMNKYIKVVLKMNELGALSVIHFAVCPNVQLFMNKFGITKNSFPWMVIGRGRDYFPSQKNLVI